MNHTLHIWIEHWEKAEANAHPDRDTHKRASQKDPTPSHRLSLPLTAATTPQASQIPARYM